MPKFCGETFNLARIESTMSFYCSLRIACIAVATTKRDAVHGA